MQAADLIGNLAALGLLSLPDVLLEGYHWGCHLSAQGSQAVRSSHPMADGLLGFRYRSLYRTTLLRMGHPYATCMAQVGFSGLRGACHPTSVGTELQQTG